VALLPRSDDARAALLGVASAAIAYLVFGGAGRAPSSDPAGAVPRDSFLVATIQVDELRRSPVYTSLFGAGGSGTRALGIGGLADACGFDPASRVRRLAIAVPEETTERGEFGVAARVEVTADELRTCADALAKERGGRAGTTRVGSFVVLEGGEGSSRPRIGFAPGGLLVVGKGTWFDAMLGAAEGSKPGLRDAEGHTALRTALTTAPEWRSPAFLVTALLPRTLRDRLKEEMGVELGATDASSVAMAGVLGVASAGLAMRTGGPGGTVDARAELRCDTADECAAVETLAKRKRLEASKDFSLRLIGLGAVFDALEISRDGARVHATLSVGADGLASTLERVLRFRGAGPKKAEPEGEAQ
jgi:hypothetical protein